MSAPRTLYDKIFDDHIVSRQEDGTCLLYIDRHLVHEVPSPQAFEGLRMAGRKVRAPEKTLADCFKYRNKIGLDVFLEALDAYRKRPGASMQKVLEYARVNRVEKNIRPYLEAKA